jgi:hypothetical protein
MTHSARMVLWLLVEMVAVLVGTRLPAQAGFQLALSDGHLTHTVGDGGAGDLRGTSGMMWFTGTAQTPVHHAVLLGRVGITGPSEPRRVAESRSATAPPAFSRSLETNIPHRAAHHTTGLTEAVYTVPEPSASLCLALALVSLGVWTWWSRRHPTLPTRC